MTMAQPLSINRTAPVLQVNGAPLAASALAALMELRITRGLRLPGRATLRFDDAGHALAAGGTFAIGATVSVAAGSGQVLLSGEVTGVDLSIEYGQPEFTVVVDDLSYKLTLGAKIRTFAAITYGEVIGQICREQGLSFENRGGTDALTVQQDYLMQSDTDFGFLTEIADRTGNDWWVEESTLVLAAPTDAQPVASLGFGDDPTLTAFTVRASALHPAEPVVHGWWPQTKQAVAAQGRAASTSSVPTLVEPFIQASDLSSRAKTVTASEVPLDQSDAEVLANRLAGRWSSGAVTARGTTVQVEPAVVPGSTVAVTGSGPASGNYHVTEIEHVYNRRGFSTRFTAGDRRPSSLVDALSTQASSSFRRQGIVIGVVTKVGNPNGSPGEVKVAYKSAGDQVESNWARVVTVGAGNGRGATFIPEINDEVIVGFEGGDSRRPIVLGGVYNGQDVPVEFGVANSKVNKRRITSRAGHFLEFGDGDATADQHISFTLAGAEHQIVLGKEKFEATVPSGKPMTIKSGNSSIAIGADGSITIQGQKITLKADTDVEISGVNVTTKASVKAETSATQIAIKASATGEVSSGGMMSVKGAMVAVN